jgi:hypothetical protein
MKLQFYLYVVLLLILNSCASYNDAMDSYYEDVRAKQYDAAQKKLNSNKLLKQSRNRLIYCMEAGKLYHLKKDYKKSNEYFNEADRLAENLRQSAGNLTASLLLNPMCTAYTGEDFEKHMLHYYKALNYAALGLYEDAAVEARRINLTTQIQADKVQNKTGRYSKDAFALNLQGILFESNGDINNAFIAYRNAADLYLEAKGVYYGVNMPLQLQQDVLRTANQLGFYSEEAYYKKKFGCNYDGNLGKQDFLVLFLEEGNAPVKIQETYWLNAAQGGRFYYNGNGLRDYLDFDYVRYGYDESQLSSLGSFKIAMPGYRVQSGAMNGGTIVVNGLTYSPVMMQNLNTVATQSLRERFASEMARALARQLSKKLVEVGAGAIAKEISGNKNEHKTDTTKSAAENEANKQQVKEKARMAGKTVSAIAGIVNRITEKADTRNWQSLPAYISYVRIPLQQGANKISIVSANRSKELTVYSTGRLQILNETLP